MANALITIIALGLCLTLVAIATLLSVLNRWAEGANWTLRRIWYAIEAGNRDCEGKSRIEVRGTTVG